MNLHLWFVLCSRSLFFQFSKSTASFGTRHADFVEDSSSVASLRRRCRRKNPSMFEATAESEEAHAGEDEGSSPVVGMKIMQLVFVARPER